ncbi:DUF7507 domain-containing protein, partial [Erythrobacter alti]|uniref:DUF7507 domain-containing protein n=1 Tax=Erythrobacter alti TaxID=1896145 RepID=UPI0030F3A10E
VTAMFGTQTVDAGPSSVHTPIDCDPVLAIDKKVIDVGGDGPDGTIDAAGDVVTYDVVVTNNGNVTLTGVVVSDPLTGLVLELADDGILAPGESYTFSGLTYMVTQADMDSNGTAEPDNMLPAFLDNTAVADSDQTDAVDDSEAVPLLVDPDISILKEVTAISGGDDVNDTPLDTTDDVIDSAGDTITYTITVTNEGNVTLTAVDVSDVFEGSGYDISGATLVESVLTNGVLDVGESWTYEFTVEVTQMMIDTNCYDGGDEQITNSASVTAMFGTQTVDAGPSSVHTPIDCDPSIDVEKLVSIDDNVFDPILDDHDDPMGPQATTANTPIYFMVITTNTGNVTLTGLDFSDILSSPASSVFAGELDYTDPLIDAWVDLDGSGTRDAGEDWATVDGADGTIDGVLDNQSLAPGETLNVFYTLPFEAGQHINTITVSTDQGAMDTDAAHYFGLLAPEPGVRTPGFWQNPNNGGTFWDGIADNQAHHGPEFPDGDPASDDYNEDLLYNVDSNNDGVINAADKLGLLVGDYNRDGLTNPGEDTFFISLFDAQNLVNASNKNGNDVIHKLGRDVVATWLNFLANNQIGDGSPDTAKHYLDDAIDWMQSFADGSPQTVEFGETFDDYVAGSTIKNSSGFWKNPQGDSDHAGADIHNALAEYNEGGTVNGVFLAGDGDSAAYQAALSEAIGGQLFMLAPGANDPFQGQDGMTIVDGMLVPIGG